MGAYLGFHYFERGGGGFYFRDLASDHDPAGDVLVVSVGIPYYHRRVDLRVLWSLGRVSMKIAPSPVDWSMIPTGIIMTFLPFWLGLFGRAAFLGPLTVPMVEYSHDERAGLKACQ